MDLIIVGPGRAGTSLGLAARSAGHRVVGVLGRSDVTSRAELLGAENLRWDRELPAADLLVVAVRDDAIATIAEALASLTGSVSAAVHLSGLATLEVLDPLCAAGLRVGGFHPLQTMPNPEDGSRALRGAYVGITADEELAGVLADFAESIGTRPFSLDDSQRPLYHAAAASSANYVLTALGLAEEIFTAAGVPFEAARPLVEEVVANAFDIGPRTALTGPIARGDHGTVASQVAAVEGVDQDLAEVFKAFGRATARMAGAGDEILEILE